MSLLKETLASIIRKLLPVLFGWLIVPLIAHNWLSSDLGDRWRAMLDSSADIIAATILTLIVPIVWGWWQKVVAKARVIAAGAIEPGAVGSPHDVARMAAAQVADLSPRETLAVATKGAS